MLINGINLYSLANAVTRFGNYYVDRTFNVYSMKSGTLKKLAGSKTYRGRYYTLNNESVSEDAIKRYCGSPANYTKFISETQVGGLPTAGVAAAVPANRQYAQTVDEGIKLRGKIIASVDGGRLVFGSNPKIHTSDSSWRDEIERLAKNNPGVKFIVLSIQGALVAGGVTWS